MEGRARRARHGVARKVGAGLAGALGIVLASSTAAAESRSEGPLLGPRAVPIPYWDGAKPGRWGSMIRFEGDAFTTIGVFPVPWSGGRIGLALGRPAVHVRVGVAFAGTPSFDVGSRQTSVGFMSETAQLGLCAAGHWRRHRLRGCAGAEAGGMHIRWSGWERPGARSIPWAAALFGGDYSLALGSNVDLRAGVDAVVPMAAPRVVASREGQEVAEFRGGRLGATFRVGIGLRLE